jgi:hypothetical protein
MKKFVCIMVLACLVLSAAFAQKASFGVDIFQLLKGVIGSDSDSDTSIFITSVGYESLIAPHFSFGIDGDVHFIKVEKIDCLYFGVAAAGRYYPMSAGIDKFFIGTSVGFNSFSVDGKTKPENGGFQGLFTSLKVGYKIVTKGFYIEPSMSYVLSKIGIYTPPLGWNGGLRIGLLF